MSIWQRIRRPLIGSAVSIHFLTGFLCFLTGPAALLEIDALAGWVSGYGKLGFAQTWRMFAPPARAKYSIGYALSFDGGWSELLVIDDVLADRTRGHFFLPRGQIRIGNHMRHPNLRTNNLDEEPFFRHYFQQLAAYYCFGDGAIPDLRTIRFYSIIDPITPFHPDDPATPPDAEKTVTALYERRCDDR